MAIGNINPSTTTSDVSGPVWRTIRPEPAVRNGGSVRLPVDNSKAYSVPSSPTATSTTVVNPVHTTSTVPSRPTCHTWAAPSGNGTVVKLPTNTPPAGSNARRVGTMCGSDRSATRATAPSLTATDRI